MYAIRSYYDSTAAASVRCLGSALLLPVVEDGRVIAMISIGDLVQAIIADQREEIV